MQSRLKRFRRRFRTRQRQVENFSQQAESLAEGQFFRRLDRLAGVKRFVIGWIVLFVLIGGVMVGQIRALGGYFQTLQPIPGGIYSEGILGDFTNASPLYAGSEVDESVSRLVFAGLFKYNDRNKLVGDLAQSWSVNATGRVYTVQLKSHLTWQDGQPLTAADVAFTYRVIQNPDALSPLRSSWQGIIVAATGPLSVSFTLPNSLSSFPYNMTNGIIPEHLLKQVPMSEMRSTSFNTLHPVGSGPFSWQDVQVSGQTPEQRQEQVTLVPFGAYQGGAPKLSSFVIRAFHSEQHLTDSFRKHELTAASLSEVPDDIAQNQAVQSHDFLLSAANMVFFREGNPLFTDQKLRRGLVQAVDVSTLVGGLGYPTHPVREPLLVGQLGYDPTVAQLPYDTAAANAQLDATGWKLAPDGFRYKQNRPLKFTLVGQQSQENQYVTTQLHQAWRAVGVQAIIKLENSDDLQQTVSNHDYDALLYGISIGTDPDVFVYWHSSQADPRSPNRLNFSEYKSKPADQALEAGRTRTDPALRIIKYKPFLQAWQQDAPALGLYQPRYQYLTYGDLSGLNQHVLNSDTDRYDNVQNWEIRQASLTN